MILQNVCLSINKLCNDALHFVLDFSLFLIDYQSINIRTYNSTMVHFIPYIILCSCLTGWIRIEDVASYLRTYSMTSGGRRGAITDLLTTSRHPFRSFDTLRDSAARRQVQSLILSSHRFLWPPLLLPPLTVPCMIVFERPEDLERGMRVCDICIHSEAMQCKHLLINVVNIN